jgi:hypothetical protein
MVYGHVFSWLTTTTTTTTQQQQVVVKRRLVDGKVPPLVVGFSFCLQGRPRIGDMTIPDGLRQCALGREQLPLPLPQQIPIFIPGRQRTKRKSCFDPGTFMTECERMGGQQGYQYPQRRKTIKTFIHQ